MPPYLIYMQQNYQDIVPRANDPALASQEYWASPVKLDTPPSLAFLRTTAHHSKGHQDYICIDVHVKPTAQAHASHSSLQTDRMTALLPA